MLSSNVIDCPYCGERIELVVDTSLEESEYTEDCEVCCRPIVLSISVVDDEVSIGARTENE